MGYLFLHHIQPWLEDDILLRGLQHLVTLLPIDGTIAYHIAFAGVKTRVVGTKMVKPELKPSLS